MGERSAVGQDGSEIDWTEFNRLCVRAIEVLVGELPSHYGDASLKKLFAECYHVNAPGFFAPTDPLDTPSFSKQHKKSEKDQKRALLQWIGMRKDNKLATPAKIESFLNFCIRANNGRLTSLISVLLKCSAVQSSVSRTKLEEFRDQFKHSVNVFKSLPGGNDRFYAEVYGFEFYRERILVDGATADVLHEISGTVINLGKNELSYYKATVFTDNPIDESELKPEISFIEPTTIERNQSRATVTKWGRTEHGGGVGVIEVRFPRPIKQYESLRFQWKYHSPGSFKVAETSDYHQCGVNTPVFRHSFVLEYASKWRFVNVEIDAGVFEVRPPHILRWDMVFPKPGAHRVKFSLVNL